MSSSFFAAVRRSSCAAASGGARPPSGCVACRELVQRRARARSPMTFICFTYSAFVSGGELLLPQPGREKRHGAEQHDRPESPRPHLTRSTGRDLDSTYGQGARAPVRVRAAAQAAAAAHRRDRPGRRRGARGRARQAEHQEGLEALGARARDPLLRPDDARGAGHARQGRGALQQGGAARPDRPERPVGRRRLRLPEPRADRGRAAPRDRRQGRVRRDRVPVRPEPARREGARRRGRRSRSAPTRSTW